MVYCSIDAKYVHASIGRKLIVGIGRIFDVWIDYPIALESSYAFSLCSSESSRLFASGGRWVAFRLAGFVEAVAGNARLLCKPCHIPSPCDIAKNSGDKTGVAVLESHIEVGDDVGVTL